MKKHTLPQISAPMSDEIMTMGMADTVRSSFIALPIISLFEIIMIVRRFMIGISFSIPSSVAHLALYLFLLAVSVVTLIRMRSLGKDTRKNARRIYLMQSVYSTAIVAWALGITFVGCHFEGYFDYLVYVTIVIVVPLFSFICPLEWTSLQLLSSICMMCFARPYAGFQAFLINFTVFTVISAVGSWRLYRVRRTAYQRQTELVQERDQTRYNAHHDALTGLPNRRAYTEDLEKAQTEGLILAMFDVNGLKVVNDQLGHEAGDELLRGAAECLTSAFSDLGTVYRVGGDEFTGIFTGTAADLDAALARFSRLQSSWKGNLVPELSISAGTAIAAALPGKSLKELEIIADDAMYAAKKKHYEG